MSRNLLVDVAIRTTGSADLRTAAGDVDRMGLAGQRTTQALTLVGAAAGVAGIAGLRMGADYDQAADLIASRTGAVGVELAGLEQSARNVGGRVREEFGLVAGVMTELHQRTGLAGEPLEALTQKVIEFSRVTGTDAVENTALVTRLFGDWSVATEDQTEVMDQLLRASQETGLEVDQLMQTVVQFGAPLRLLGFSMQESVALLAKWEEEGVNTETMLTGLKFGVKSLAAEGVPANQMAATLRDRIEAIGDSADPVSEAMRLFGLRAGPDLAAAIKEGRFATDDLLEVIENGDSTIQTAVDSTHDLGDGFAELKNQVKLAIGPMLDDLGSLGAEMGNIIYLLPALTAGIGKLAGSLLATASASAAAAGGWSALAASMLPVLAIGAAVAGGFLLVDQGLNIAAGHARDATAAFEAMSEEERQAAADSEILGQRAGDLSEHFANLLNVLPITAWHSVADESRAAADALNATGTASLGAEKNIGELTRGVGELSEAARYGAGSFEQYGGAAVDAGNGLRRGSDLVRIQADIMADYVPDALRGARTEAAQIAGETPGAIAARLRDGRDSWRTSLDLLKNDLQTSMQRGKEIAELEAVLTGKAISRGLASTDPIVRAQAQETVNQIESRLEQLGAVGTAAGNALGRNTVAGLRAWQAEWFAQLHKMAGTAETLLKTHSPAKAGPWSRDGGPEGWIRSLGKRMMRGLNQELSTPVHVPAIGLPTFAGGAAGGGTAAGRTYHITVQTLAGDRVAIGREIVESIRAFERSSGTETS